MAEQAREDGAGDDHAAGVDEVVLQGLGQVGRGEQLQDDRADTGAGTGQGGGDRPEAAVGEGGEDQLGAQALGQAGVDGADAPLVAQGGRDDRGEHLDEQRGAGLADDQAADGAAEQPDADGDAAQTRGQRVHGGRPGVADGVPHPEDQAAGHAEHGGDDDVDHAPVQAAGGVVLPVPLVLVLGRLDGRRVRGRRVFTHGGFDPFLAPVLTGSGSTVRRALPASQPLLPGLPRMTRVTVADPHKPPVR